MKCLISLFQHSDCSLPSLNSPSDSLVDDDQISTFMNLQMEDDPDLLLKAPYIPMNVTDDLPLLMSNDLMWSSNEKKHQQLTENSSSLAQLLSTSLNKHNLKSNDHGGGLLQEHATLEYMYNNEKSKYSQIFERSDSELSIRTQPYEVCSLFDQPLVHVDFPIVTYLGLCTSFRIEFLLRIKSSANNKKVNSSLMRIVSISSSSNHILQ